MPTQFEEVTRAHEKLADNGSNFALALHQMHDELTELAGNSERGRKQWKSFGTAAEKRVHEGDAEHAGRVDGPVDGLELIVGCLLNISQWSFEGDYIL